MHLLTFLQLKQPGSVFRGLVWMSQGIFFNFFFLAYLVSPKFCHRVSPRTHSTPTQCQHGQHRSANTVLQLTHRELSAPLHSCSQLVGYLEEEAVKTYTETLKRQRHAPAASSA